MSQFAKFFSSTGVSLVPALLILTASLPVWASLGGDVVSVQADQVHMQGSLRTTENSAYSAVSYTHLDVYKRQERDGAHFHIQFAYKTKTLLDHLHGMRTGCAGFACQGSQLHTQGSKNLPGAVVELASDAPSVIILHLQYPTGQVTQTRLRLLTGSRFCVKKPIVDQK